MAKISLREYNHEIEKLIDHGQTEEASAHCKYILKIFPKHLDTYRLLGKTYLESQRYSEAADILQRVLAVVPDDFVSQIGLSIIREDEGNLDAAIWNMERAFEVQPSNAAVQEELRRLYGNRDGVQPPRVRLTRGALVRMYTKGNLYQQAIAEARAAIAESPKRIDLEILLARNYHLSKNFVEATDICSRLVKKMPYCYEANRILADILPKANKMEEAKIFAKRVQELDPYAAFTDPSAATSAQAPDDAVTLEKLDWQPSMEETEQPRWAKSIGVEIGSQSDQPSTDWLSDLPESGPDLSAPMPFIIPEISSTQSEDSLPGWMKEDEWNTDKGAESRAENQQSSAFIIDEDEELHEAEIPEWLQSMAPDQIDQGQPSASASSFEIHASEASDAPDWLNKMDNDTPAAKDSRPVSEPLFMTAESEGEEDVPEWMQSMDINGEAPAEPASDTIPDFSANEPEKISFATEPAVEDTPDWLKDLESSASESNEKTRTSEGIKPGLTDMLGESTQEPEVPDWLNGIEDDASAPVISEPTSAAAPAEDHPDWLQDLESAAQQPAAQPEIPEVESPGLTDMLGKSTQEPEVPDWLNDIEDDAAAPVISEPTSAAAPAEDLPDWLQDIESAAQQPAAQPEIPEVESPGLTDMLGKSTQEPEVPDWLNDIEEDQAAPATSEPTAAAAPTEDLPDWLQDLESAAQQPAAQPEIPEVESPGLTDMLGKSTQEPEVPDWLNDIEDDEIADATSESTSAVAPVTADEMPDWLQEFDTQEPPSEMGRELPSSQTVPPTGSDELPDWLPLNDEFPDIKAEHPAAILGEDKEQAQDQTPPEESGEIPEDPDEAFAWLESLATQQGADENVLSSLPEERNTTVPDWLQELDQTTTDAQPEPENLHDSKESPADSSPAQDNTASTDSLPDWLHDFSDGVPQESKPETPPSPVMEKSAPLDSQEEEQPPASVSVPDWLNDLAEENTEPLEPLQGSQDNLDWMQSEDKASENLDPAAKPASLPDWLEKLKPAAEETTTEAFIPPAVLSDDETVAHLRASQDEIQPQASEAMPADADDAFAWLESLAAKHGAEEDALVTAIDERQDTPPDWVQDLASAEEAQPKEEPAQTDTFSISDLDTGVDLLNPAEEIPTDSNLEEEAEAKAQQWLQSLASGKPVGDIKIAPPTEDEISPQIIEQSTEQLEQEITTPLTDKMPSDPTEAFAWLESLAAQQGADEESLSTPPEERDSATPDWLLEMEETGTETQPEQENEFVAEDVSESPLTEIMPSETVDLTRTDEMPSDPAEAFAWLESLACPTRCR